MKRKFTDDEVRSIRWKREQGETLEVLADWYGVAVTTIWKIVNRRSYEDVV